MLKKGEKTKKETKRNKSKTIQQNKQTKINMWYH